MQAHWADPEVFIRSMATRGALGGPSRATADAVAILDAAGKDIVLVETVGVGQDEVDIAGAAHTVIVLSAPGLGDEVQTLKAGLLEVADVHVVNKADRDGAQRTQAELRSMLRLSAPDGWVAPVLPTCAESGEGVTELADALDRHHDWLLASGGILERCRGIARHRLKTLLIALVHERLDRPVPGSAFDSAIEALCQRTTDPWTAASALVEKDLTDLSKGRP
jgi:LAO/AO transport system kinase